MLNMSAIKTPSGPDDHRDTAGHFQKGKSGNPAGRPRGSRNKATLMMEQLLEDHGQEILDKLIARALEGDTHAIGIYMDRTMPRCKERTITLDAGPIRNLQDVVNVAAAIVDALAQGEITPTEAEKAMNILRFPLDAVLALDLERRVAVIEQKLHPLKAEAEMKKERLAEEYQRVMSLVGEAQKNYSKVEAEQKQHGNVA